MYHTARTIIIAALALGIASTAFADDVVIELDAGDGFVIENAGSAIERLRVDEDTGNISRNGALFVHTTGTDNTFVGAGAGNLATTGAGVNTAVGNGALSSNTTGTANSAFGYGALTDNTSGDDNAAFGTEALFLNQQGIRNSAFGSHALRANVSSYNNSAFGAYALQSSTAGGNSAFGSSALYSNTTGSSNTAVGRVALRTNMTGGGNVAVGDGALFNATASSNTAIGFNAGGNQTTGGDNIYIANGGVAGESGKIRIGTSAHTETFIEGINGNTATGGMAVLINSSNELHTLVSSIRFKESVRDMGEASEVVMQLRPVTFRYREEAAGEGAGPEYGLIAEEVAKVAPELVALDAEARPYSVRYHVLAPMLLNEMQKQQRIIDEQREVIAGLAGRLDRLESRLGSDREGSNR
jgi:hypothetical protein